MHYLWNSMSRVNTYHRLLSGVLLLVMIAFTSCSKEELDGPACGATEADGSAKSFDLSGGSAGTTMNGSTSGGAGSSGDGRGISDDGDDLSDSEKGRKKKVN
jgi:hypothetical protein